MKEAKKKNLFRLFVGNTVLFLNIIAVVLLFLSYLASWISPDLIWILAFFGLAYPVFLVINIVFMLYYLIRLKRYLFISLIAILIGYFHVGNLVSLRKKAIPEGVEPINVLSYNVRNFDLYNYKKNWTLNFTNRDSIFSFVDKGDFDIICFQEFVYDKSGKFQTLDTLQDFQKARHAHAAYTKNSRNLNFFGIATFSAFPIVNKGKIPFRTQAGNICIFTDIKKANDTIRVYNIHLESIGLSQEDYQFVENMNNIIQTGENQEIKTGGKRIFRRLKRAFLSRAEQAELVAEHIAKSPYPVILTGDFNDTPSSYVYRVLSKNLRDAFHAGRGLGRTYVGSVPSFRIDYIMHSKTFDAYDFVTGNKKFSDHYPVYCKLVLRNDN
ncbi:MAG: hypothetical protein GX587_02405 [Bacteroidales bacterium]|nr:hypothetical protein [Bacteroidales bacterium]